MDRSIDVKIAGVIRTVKGHPREATAAKLHYSRVITAIPPVEVRPGMEKVISREEVFRGVEEVQYPLPSTEQIVPFVDAEGKVAHAGYPAVHTVVTFEKQGEVSKERLPSRSAMGVLVSPDTPNLPPSRREVIILANPLAGTHARAQASDDLVAALRNLGMDAAICHRREDLPDWVKERGERLRCVVAAGGDGTFNEVLNRVPGVPLAILPLGNENLVARHFHFQHSPADLAHTIAHAPVRQLDLARVNERYFSVMAGAGFDAEVVHHVHARRTSHINKLHYVPPIWRALRGYSFPEIEMEIEETGECLRGAMVFVFNLPQYGLRLPLALRARADDGLLDLLVFERPGVLNLARYVGAVMRQQHERLRDVKHRLVRRIHLRSRRPAPLQVDGDPAGFLPVTIEIAPGTLHLLAPTVSASGASPR